MRSVINYFELLLIAVLAIFSAIPVLLPCVDFVLQHNNGVKSVN